MVTDEIIKQNERINNNCDYWQQGDSLEKLSVTEKPHYFKGF